MVMLDPITRPPVFVTVRFPAKSMLVATAADSVVLPLDVPAEKLPLFVQFPTKVYVTAVDGSDKFGTQVFPLDVRVRAPVTVKVEVPPVVIVADSVTFPAAVRVLLRVNVPE